MVLKIMNLIRKVFYQNHTLTECKTLYHNLKRLSIGDWITVFEKTEIARVGPMPIYNETTRELRPHKTIGLKGNGLLTMDNFWRIGRMTGRTQSRTTIAGRDKLRSPRPKLSRAIFLLEHTTPKAGFQLVCYQSFRNS